MKFSTLLFYFILFLAAACGNDDDAEPRPETPLEELNRRVPKTQTGVGKFGCLIGDELWIAQWDGPFDPAVRATYYEDSDNIFLIANMDDPKSRDGFHKMYLNFGNVSNIGEGKYSPFKGKAFLGRFGNRRMGEWIIDTTKINSLEITSLRGAPDFSLSGEFSLTLYKSGSSDTLKVTEGRFDTYWTQY